MDTPIFGDFYDFRDFSILCPGSSPLLPWKSLEVPGRGGKPTAPERWPESSGRGLDDDFLIKAFSCQVWSFAVLLGHLQVVPGGCRAASNDVPGGEGKPRAPERVPESSGRGLDDDFLIKAFSCKM